MGQIKEITSIADLEPAMQEMQRLDSVIRSGYEDLAKKQASLREKADAIYADDIQRKEELEQIIHAYVDKHKPEVFANGKKSREFPSGTISLRLGPLAVSLRKDATIETVRKVAAKLKLVILRQPPEELDKEAVKKHIKAGIIDGEKLQELGIVATQSETINIKLNDK